jgi:hypothetical protein
VRAALLPFALATVVWFLWRSRSLAGGWLGALVGVLGFLIGLAPWAVRTYQVFGEPVPVVDSAGLHFWVGNNPQADGGPLTEAMIDKDLAKELSDVSRQPERYARLGARAWEDARQHPDAALRRRLQAALAFLVGADWLRNGTLAETVSPPEGDMPERLGLALPAALQATLLGMLALAFLGWRWSYGWRWESLPASLAVVWIPLPYILTHAGRLSGPRLPLDGVLLCYAAFALVGLVPGVGGLLREGGNGAPERRAPAP